ncbi:methyltransferase family protein [Planctomicrobium piriforme]|uniref:Phospholipid methyltransferase n=1 Tax=Planctomicrobium piriforme TaxID=1576369 RepID=A0A1I3C8R8_9PLAN|nr:isoprenylcysteine carboxylmethyltransferase family protein [Planctomicrobium piriforme]SFH70716.1 Phospholipid methyltransferase [Planctomicrobium piriforme]
MITSGNTPTTTDDATTCIAPPQPPAKAVEPLRVRQFQAYRWRIPLTATCLITGFGLALLSPPRILVDSQLDQWIDVSGYLLVAAGIALRLWAISSIDTRKSVVLVTSGPYGLCRNPLYVGTFLIAIGFLCLVQSLTMTLLTLPIILLYMWGVVPAEERVMRSRHGAAFDEYCAAVPRWIPHLHAISQLQVRPVWTSGLRREVECGLWWIAIAIVVHVTCDMRMEPWWNHPFNCP